MTIDAQQRKQRLSQVLTFWTDEHSLSVMLALLVLDLFLLTPGWSFGKAVQFVSVLFLILALLAGILSLTRKVMRQLGTLLVVCTITLRTATAFSDAPLLVAGETLFTLLSLVALIMIVYRQVSKEGPVSGHMIRGAIALYLLIAMLFAFLYGLAEQLTPGAFNIPGSLFNETMRGDTFFYFSVVTLTTVGFGDITAVHPFVRSLVMLEALVGQLYPAILIGRLVSLQLEYRRGGR